MKIKTMKELKSALNKIPDEVLDHFSVSLTDDGLALSTDYTDRKVDFPDQTDWMDYFDRQVKKYPELDLIQLYFGKILNAEPDEGEEGIEVTLPKKPKRNPNEKGMKKNDVQ